MSTLQPAKRVLLGAPTRPSCAESGSKKPSPCSPQGARGQPGGCLLTLGPVHRRPPSREAESGGTSKGGVSGLRQQQGQVGGSGRVEGGTGNDLARAAGVGRQPRRRQGVGELPGGAPGGRSSQGSREGGGAQLHNPEGPSLRRRGGGPFRGCTVTQAPKGPRNEKESGKSQNPTRFRR